MTTPKRTIFSRVIERVRDVAALVLPWLQWAWDRALAWWKPQPRLVKIIAALVVLLPLAYHFFLKTTDKPFEMEVQRKGAVPYDVYLVDVREVENDEETPAADQLRLAHGSILRPFGVVIRFYNLVPKRAYQVSCQVQDPKGTVLKSERVRNLQSDTAESWAYFPFYPDLEQHAAGTWKAAISIAGVGEVAQEFEVKGLTSDEKQLLANHEEAREHALKAFSQFWCVVPHQKTKTYVTASHENMSGQSPLQRFSLFQVGGVDYTMTQMQISEADRLNGISYRGAAGFGFTVWRTYEPDEGWTEWTDVNRPANPLAESWFGYTGSGNVHPKTAQDAPLMRFQLEKRDGHWHVVSSEGLRFIDGTRKGLAKAPFLKEISERQLLKADMVFQPDIEKLAVVSDDGATLRAELKGLAGEVAADPYQIKKQQAMTMEALE